MTRWADSDEFQERLTAVADATQRMLACLLADAPLAGEVARPARFMTAMRYAALGGGKRLRPFLLVEAARLFGVEGDGVLRAACALEMIHCYSLVHDDLPAMDDDDLRRGRPTTHKAFDEATAILVGDGLLTYAFDVTADPLTHPDPAIRAELVLQLARHSGVGGMVGGQMFDLEAEAKTEPHRADEVIRIQSMKTGALLHYAVLAGAILGGAGAESRDAISRYGRAVGAAFQVADDILDVEADEVALGKKTGKDAGRNKATLVAALGLEAARSRRDRLALDAIAALDAIPAHALRGRSDALKDAAHFAVERRS
jgi:farnesyl diphosphate synthase